MLKEDFDGDGKIDSAYIIEAVPRATFRRIMSEEGGAGGSTEKHDYVMVVMGSGFSFGMNFPFVEEVQSMAKAAKDPDLASCIRKGAKGFFATSEEGAVFIYWKKTKFVSRACFL